jgi:broad specificity phosphatase PhoE
VCGVVNHLGGIDRLANQYYAMRHGQSRANADGIIVSRVETDARGDYGLTEQGREQVRAAARACAPPAGPLGSGTLIYASDFARAAQTALIMREHLRSAGVVTTPALRERYFGRWDGTPTGNYRAVWATDEAGADQAGDGDGVEPADAVLDRATALIRDLEREHSGQVILLVSHGDTLQILQAGFARMDAGAHRRLPHLATAEVRRLELAIAPGRLPD